MLILIAYHRRNITSVILYKICRSYKTCILFASHNSPTVSLRAINILPKLTAGLVVLLLLVRLALLHFDDVRIGTNLHDGAGRLRAVGRYLRVAIPAIRTLGVRRWSPPAHP